VLVLVLAAFLAALAPQGALYAEEDGYRIKPGDLLSVSVWREPDLQLQILVRPDGRISLPLAGGLLAEGRTPERLGLAISERLAKFIPDASVSVAVLEIRGNSIYVIGRVAAPGQYVMHKTLDVMQALSMAGGTTTFAKLNDIRILRREGQRQTATPFRYQEVAEGENLEQNILLRSGDVIVVP